MGWRRPGAAPGGRRTRLRRLLLVSCPLLAAAAWASRGRGPSIKESAPAQVRIASSPRAELQRWLAHARDRHQLLGNDADEACTTPPQVTYVPGELEVAWIAESRTWKGGASPPKEVMCSRMIRHVWATARWVAHVEGHAAADDVMSTISVRDGCGKKPQEVRQIEPLFGALRHPSYPYDRKLGSDAMWHVLAAAPKGRGRRFLFDIGAGNKDQPKHDLFSLRHLTHEYWRQRKVRFDAIFAWEPADVPGLQKLLSELDPHSLGALVWIPAAATPEAGSPSNPLTWVKKLTEPEDLVVVKLDTNDFKGEMELADQVASDPELAARIDDLFYEHHVWGNDATNDGWWQRLQEQNVTHNGNMLYNSFHMFTNLREKGVGAHSWI